MTRTTNATSRIAAQTDELDQRFQMATGVRRQLNKVFPTHWSFLLGEIALYSFILLLLSGTYLAFFFDPSMTEVSYQGVYTNLRGVDMSRAYASALDISFEVRGGLIARQIHHWAALLFTAAIVAHMFRIFFTGAFRRPRETNWTIGIGLFVTAMFEGFTGYSLPDDLLSGTGVRIASGITMSIPVLGTWAHWLLFGSEFPGTEIIPRFYLIHIFVLPGIILGLIAVHLALVWYQKHTQFPGVSRTESNVLGVRIVPVFAVKASGFFAIVTGITVVMAGLFQINAIWQFGPYVASQVSAASQPDWYMMWTDGLGRLWPSWEVYLWGQFTIPAPFFLLIMGMGIIFTIALAYPGLERKLSGDDAHHNLLQRPRDVPVRTSLGAMAITFFLVILISGTNDIIAFQFNISLNAMTWIGRIGVLIAPPLAYWITYRVCLGLQRSDREVLEHGVETGIITRRPDGGFIEVHQPLSVDRNGTGRELSYQGAPVPKKMNELGAAGEPVPGSLLWPDPPDETEQLSQAQREPSQYEQNRTQNRPATRTSRHRDDR